MPKPNQVTSLVYFIYVVCLGGFFYGITSASIRVFLFTRAPQYTLDLVQLLAILFVALGIGHLVVHRLRIAFDSSVDLAINSVALGFGIMSLLMLGMGLLSLYYQWIAWPLLVLGCCWSISYNLRSGLLRMLCNGFRSPRDIKGLGYISGLSIIGAVSAVGYSLVVNALVPPLEWDSMAYHLAIPKLYVTAHQITYIPYIVHSNWPFNMEMLYTLALLVGSERLPQLIAFSFALLTGLAMFTFARRHFDKRAGLLSVAVFFSLPIIRKVSGTSMVDIPLGLFAFLAVVAFWRWQLERREGWLVLSALFGGFAAGTKLTAASTAILLGVALFVVAIVNWRKTKKFHLRELLIFAVFSIAPVFPWYVKSYLLTGNPVWPFLDSIFASKDWDAWGTLVHNAWLHSPGTGTSLQSLLLLPWNLSSSEWFGPPLGIPIIAFLPAAILFHRKVRLSWFLVVFTFATVMVWFYLTQQNRFLSPALPIICLLAGTGFWCLYDLVPFWFKGSLALLLTVWMFLNSPFTSPAEQAVWSQRLSYVSGQVSREALLSGAVNAYNVFNYANSNLPANARILLLPYENRGFYLDRSYFWGNPVSQRVLKFDQMGNAGELLRTTKELGLSHVLINPAVDLPQMPFSQTYNKLIDDFRAKYLVPIYTANGVTIYEIRDEKPEG